jgi:hypothetical protein
MSTVIASGLPSASAQSTPGKSVPAAPNFEHVVKNLRRSIANFGSDVGICLGLGEIVSLKIPASTIADPGGAFSNPAPFESSPTLLASLMNDCGIAPFARGTIRR